MENFDLIKLIAKSIPPLKYQCKKNQFKKSLFKIIKELLKSFNLEIIKFRDDDQFPFIGNYFDGKNKIQSKNKILFDLIYWFNRKINLKL